MSLDSFFRGKKVLITGHTGFKGSWLSIWLKRLGAEICGYALAPYTRKDNFVVSGVDRQMLHCIGDVRSYPDLKRVFDTFQPLIVFHLAAQPLVRRSYADPKETFDVNIGGTVNLLECCRLSDSVAIVINVTSDKCYENREWPWGYRESDPLGGRDPYSASKAGCEIVSRAYRDSFFTGRPPGGKAKWMASVRAGNVIGGGDWREDRLIPDCIRALERGEPVRLRNPDAVRPWQFVLEPLSGYLLLAAKMAGEPDKYATAWNFGPPTGSRYSVGEIAERVLTRWGVGTIQGDRSEEGPHEAGTLWLDSTKALTELGWKPMWNMDKSIAATVDWYKRYESESMYAFCERQIDRYMASGSQT